MRLIIAVWAAKLLAAIGMVMGKKSSSKPGEIALKICPDLIEKLKKNIKGEVFVTCGTNGKTTTNNLLCSALEKSGKTVVCNRVGANMISGVANVLALSCNIFGKFKADNACLEIDEASAVKVFDKIKPDVMIITNLFRDQLDRYGEIGMTVDLINRAIDKCDKLKLVLNGDDPICASFGKGRDAVYFGVSEPVMEQTDGTREGRYCSECMSELSYKFYHYSQLGDYYCENCGNKRPLIDFEATDVSILDGLKFNINKTETIDINYRGFYNIYNILAVYAALKTADIEGAKFSDMLADYKPQIGRMEEFKLDNKSVILNLAKNPAGFNQAIMTVCADKRKKDVIIAINDAPGDGLDISWLWDVDFEKLCGENTGLIITNGKRRYDLTLRFKYNDIKVNFCTVNMKEAIEKCLASDSEVVYALVNYTALFSTQNILLEIKKEKEEEK